MTARDATMTHRALKSYFGETYKGGDREKTRYLY